MTVKQTEKFQAWIKFIIIVGSCFAGIVGAHYSLKGSVRVVDAKIETHIAVSVSEKEHSKDILERIEKKIDRMEKYIMTGKVE